MELRASGFVITGMQEQLRFDPTARDRRTRDGPPAPEYPMLLSPHFLFRSFVPADIRQLVALAGEHRIANTTIGIPHPHTAEFARMWISTHGASWAEGHALHWGVHRIDDDRLAGYAGLSRIDAQRRQAELRFWVGCGVQKHSDATECAQTVVDFAWSRLKMWRIYALQLARHPLAGRVLSGLGMQPDGLVRKRIQPEGQVEDVVCWSLVNGQ